MAGTTTIPLISLANGAHVFGPATVADADQRAVLNIDRTVAGGLASLTAAATLEMLVEQSNDAGATWFLITDATMTGGPKPAPLKGAPGTDTVWAQFEPGTGRRVRATLTIAGGPVAVQGTLTVS
jgi:hypothetical protein